MQRIKQASLGLVAPLLIATIIGVVLGWTLGSRPADERLTMIEASSHYHDGTFMNIEPVAGFEFSLGHLKDQFFGAEQRVPPSTPPVVVWNKRRL